jgi:hypothetical protein
MMRRDGSTSWTADINRTGSDFDSSVDEEFFRTRYYESLGCMERNHGSTSSSRWTGRGSNEMSGFAMNVISCCDVLLVIPRVQCRVG